MLDEHNGRSVYELLDGMALRLEPTQADDE
jgi:hypothetical protein